MRIMAVYTVHQPPVRTADPLPGAERIVFVRDGFSFWAFLFAPLWMLWHRTWMVLLGYVLLTGSVNGVLVALGASHAALAVVDLFISLLVGLEASTLRRFTLRRRGWANVGIVSGTDLEDAERRFFGAWLRAPRPPMEAGSPPARTTAGAAGQTTRGPQAPDVIGLFPEPGAGR
jgi:Protein of unknown function (DUF2628)